MANRSLPTLRSQDEQSLRTFSPFASFYRQANRLFEDVFRELEGTQALTGDLLSPQIDVMDMGSETRVTVELPGVKEADIEVSVDDDVLMIRAEKRVERSDGNESRHISERSFGIFQRTLRLPRQVDAEKIRANFADGVLTVSLPRNAEASRGHRIAITSGPQGAPEGEQTEVKH